MTSQTEALRGREDGEGGGISPQPFLSPFPPPFFPIQTSGFPQFPVTPPFPSTPNANQQNMQLLWPPHAYSYPGGVPHSWQPPVVPHNLGDKPEVSQERPNEEYQVDTLRRVYDEGSIEIARVKVQRRQGAYESKSSEMLPRYKGHPITEEAKCMGIVPSADVVKPPPRKNRRKKLEKLQQQQQQQQHSATPIAQPWYPYMPYVQYPMSYPYPYIWHSTSDGGISPIIGSGSWFHQNQLEESKCDSHFPLSTSSNSLVVSSPTTTAHIPSEPSHGYPSVRSLSPADPSLISESQVTDVAPSDSASAVGQRHRSQLSMERYSKATLPPQNIKHEDKFSVANEEAETIRKIDEERNLKQKEQDEYSSRPSSFATASTGAHSPTRLVSGVPTPPIRRIKRERRNIGSPVTRKIAKSSSESNVGAIGRVANVNVGGSSLAVPLAMGAHESDLTYAFKKLEQSVDIFRSHISLADSGITEGTKKISVEKCHKENVEKDMGKKEKNSSGRLSIEEVGNVGFSDESHERPKWLQDSCISTSEALSLKQEQEAICVNESVLPTIEKREKREEKETGEEREHNLLKKTSKTETETETKSSGSKDLLKTELPVWKSKNELDMQQQKLAKHIEEENPITNNLPIKDLYTKVNKAPKEETRETITVKENTMKMQERQEIMQEPRGEAETETFSDVLPSIPWGDEARLSQTSLPSPRISNSEVLRDTDSTDIILNTTADEDLPSVSSFGVPSSEQQILEAEDDYRWVLHDSNLSPSTHEINLGLQEETERTEAWKAEVSLWRARLVVSLCRGHGLDTQDWSTFHLLVQHPLAPEGKLSLLHATRICAANAALGPDRLRAALLHLTAVGEVLLMAEDQRPRGWRTIRVNADLPWAPMKGSLEILRVFGYHPREDGSLRLRRRYTPEASVIARLTLDMLVLAEELRLFLSGSHPIANNIALLFSPPFVPLVGGEVMPLLPQFIPNSPSPSSSIGSYGFVSAVSASSMSVRGDSQASSAVDETEILQPFCQYENALAMVSQTAEEAPPIPRKTRKRRQAPVPPTTIDITIQASERPPSDLFSPLLSDTISLSTVSSLPELQSPSPAPHPTLSPPTLKANASTESSGSVTPIATPELQELLLESSITLNKDVTPSTDKVILEDHDGEPEHKEEHIYEEIGDMRIQVQNIKATSKSYKIVPPPLPPKTKIQDSNEEEISVSSQDTSIIESSISTKKKKRRAPMPPDLMSMELRRKEIHASLKDISSSIGESFKKYYQKSFFSSGDKAEKQQGSKSTSGYEVIDRNTPVKKLISDENQKGNPFHRKHSPSGHIGKNPFYEDLDNESDEISESEICSTKLAESKKHNSTDTITDSKNDEIQKGNENLLQKSIPELLLTDTYNNSRIISDLEKSKYNQEPSQVKSDTLEDVDIKCQETTTYQEETTLIYTKKEEKNEDTTETIDNRITKIQTERDNDIEIDIEDIEKQDSISKPLADKIVNIDRKQESIQSCIEIDKENKELTKFHITDDTNAKDDKVQHCSKADNSYNKEEAQEYDRKESLGSIEKTSSESGSQASSVATVKKFTLNNSIHESKNVLVEQQRNSRVAASNELNNSESESNGYSTGLLVSQIKVQPVINKVNNATSSTANDNLREKSFEVKIFTDTIKCKDTVRKEDKILDLLSNIVHNEDVAPPLPPKSLTKSAISSKDLISTSNEELKITDQQTISSVECPAARVDISDKATPTVIFPPLPPPRAPLKLLEDIPYIDTTDVKYYRAKLSSSKSNEYEIPDAPSVCQTSTISPSIFRKTAILLGGPSSMPFIDDTDLPPDEPPPPPPPPTSPSTSPPETPHCSPPDSPIYFISSISLPQNDNYNRQSEVSEDRYDIPEAPHIKLTQISQSRIVNTQEDITESSQKDFINETDEKASNTFIDRKDHDNTTETLPTSQIASITTKHENKKQAPSVIPEAEEQYEIPDEIIAMKNNSAIVQISKIHSQISIIVKPPLSPTKAEIQEPGRPPRAKKKLAPPLPPKSKENQSPKLPSKNSSTSLLSTSSPSTPTSSFSPFLTTNDETSGSLTLPDNRFNRSSSSLPNKKCFSDVYSARVRPTSSSPPSPATFKQEVKVRKSWPSIFCACILPPKKRNLRR